MITRITSAMKWYDLLVPDMALNTARDKDLHAARRRQWNRGFTSKGAYGPGFHASSLSKSRPINSVSSS